jgi:hypothetical protein
VLPQHNEALGPLRLVVVGADAAGDGALVVVVVVGGGSAVVLVVVAASVSVSQT